MPGLLLLTAVRKQRKKMQEQIYDVEVDRKSREDVVVDRVAVLAVLSPHDKLDVCDEAKEG